MDRTAWIAITLCVLGLIAWEIWIARQPLPTPAVVTPPSAPPLASGIPATSAPSAIATPVQQAGTAATPGPSATPAQFEEKIEMLRNADVELRLTNRGGGNSEAVLLNHVAEGDKRVVLNSPQQVPIGAIIDQPGAPARHEFNPSRDADGSVKFERPASDGITIRKKFFFPKSDEKKDNFVADMDVDLVNGGAKPYANAGYFISLGSAAPIHAKDYSYFTRIVWCIDGKAKGIDVGWFGGGSGFLGVGQRVAQPYYQQDLGNMEWAAVSNQFFTTLIAPLTAKANGVWGHRFDIKPEEKMYGLQGAMRMPAFQLPPGQTYNARFQIYAGPKIYHQLATLPHNEAEVMDFGIFKLVSQFLLNFLNLLHGWLGSYG